MSLNKFRNWNKLDSDTKKSLQKDIFDYVRLQIEDYTQQQRSPVTGGKFKALSKEYKQFKKKVTGSTDADLHLKDKMIRSIKADYLKDKIRFKVGDSQNAKAYNHNVGDTLPQRQFMPDDEGKGTRASFHKEIKDAIQEMIDDAHKG